jgi:hypothetical protein
MTGRIIYLAEIGKNSFAFAAAQKTLVFLVMSGTKTSAMNPKTVRLTQEDLKYLRSSLSTLPDNKLESLCSQTDETKAFCESDADVTSRLQNITTQRRTGKSPLQRAMDQEDILHAPTEEIVAFSKTLSDQDFRKIASTPTGSVALSSDPQTSRRLTSILLADEATTATTTKSSRPRANSGGMTTDGFGSNAGGMSNGRSASAGRSAPGFDANGGGITSTGTGRGMSGGKDMTTVNKMSPGSMSTERSMSGMSMMDGRASNGLSRPASNVSTELVPNRRSGRTKTPPVTVMPNVASDELPDLVVLPDGSGYDDRANSLVLQQVAPDQLIAAIAHDEYVKELFERDPELQEHLARSLSQKSRKTRAQSRSPSPVSRREPTMMELPKSGSNRPRTLSPTSGPKSPRRDMSTTTGARVPTKEGGYQVNRRGEAGWEACFWSDNDSKSPRNTGPNQKNWRDRK